MKKISIIAITLAVLCFVTCAVLTGCSGDNGATASDQTEAAQATQADTTEAAAATDAPATEAETTADSNASPLIGTWDYEDLSGVSYTFNADGTGEYELLGEVMSFTYTDNGDSVEILYADVDGPSALDYRIDGNVLIIKDSFGEDVKYIKE